MLPLFPFVKELGVTGEVTAVPSCTCTNCPLGCTVTLFSNLSLLHRNLFAGCTQITGEWQSTSSSACDSAAVTKNPENIYKALIMILASTILLKTEVSTGYEPWTSGLLAEYAWIIFAVSQHFWHTLILLASESFRFWTWLPSCLRPGSDSDS